jgi:hypothetical protein
MPFGARIAAAQSRGLGMARGMALQITTSTGIARRASSDSTRTRFLSGRPSF